MPPIIEVEDLTKEFRTFRRREGVKGAIQNLFVREYLTVRAVDHVSFSIHAGEMVGYRAAGG
jgi:ABC-2 type transport system ATP-binding protein